MRPLYESSGQMTETQLRAILDVIYAELDHVHAISEVTGLSTELADIDSALAALASGKSDVGHTHAYLPLAGGTLTGALNFPGSGLLDSPGTGIARLFAGGAGGLQIQANFGTIALRSGGQPCLDVKSTGNVTIENATSFDTNPTLELLERGPQGAPLFKAGGFKIGKAGDIKAIPVTGLGPPTTSHFATGEAGFYEDTTNNKSYMVHNKAGTIKKVELV